MTRWCLAIPGILMSSALAAAAQPCPGDINGDGMVTVDEILIVVNTALNGCPSQASPTPSQPPPASATPTVSRTPSAAPTATRTATPTPRFVDNGNGTITDTTTGLMWEKQGDDGGAHDKDTVYTWSQSGSTQPNGMAFAFVAALNSARFGGHRDWRVPTLDELESIVDAGAQRPGRPTVPEAFDRSCVPGCSITQCSCTRPLNYWTSTSNPANSQQAWYVLFNTGQSGVAFKTLQFAVRAVRDADD